MSKVVIILILILFVNTMTALMLVIASGSIFSGAPSMIYSIYLIFRIAQVMEDA